MMKRVLLAGICAVAFLATGWSESQNVEAAPPGQPTNWQRFYYYPYVYYPHNFQNTQKSYDHMYYRYDQQRRIPVYNKDWHNFYPSERPYHRGHHFTLDVF